jgi:hypothetical protein
LRFLGIILRVLRPEVSVYNVYSTNQFQTTFAQGRGEVKSVKSVSRGTVTVNSKEENSEDFIPIWPTYFAWFMTSALFNDSQYRKRNASFLLLMHLLKGFYLYYI